MAKKPGPKGKPKRNRMTGAEVEAANAAHEAEQGTSVQDQGATVDPLDQPFTEPVSESPLDTNTRIAADPRFDDVATEGAPDGDGELEAAHAEQPDAPAAEAAADGEPKAEGGEEDKVPNSVVKDKFKKKYIENAKASGQTSKAAKRSNWDWLAQTIAEHCLKEKDKIDIEKFINLLEANNVDHSRWTNRNKGWEGRFRMTGRVALQKVVAERGVLKTMVGESIPPTDWIAKYKAKA